MNTVTASLLTPLADGAVHVIALNGIGAAKFLGRFLVKGAGCRGNPSLEKIRAVSGPGESVIWYQSSSGGVEVHLHGGLTRAIDMLERFRQAGACVAPPSVQKSVGVLRAEALELLPHARTLLLARMVLHQSCGALARAVDNLLKQIECCPVDDNRWVTFRESLGRLRETSILGRMIRCSLRVVIAGPPGSGKSSLFNALTASATALTGMSGSTTRDCLEGEMHIGGIPMVVVDTPGFGPTRGPREQRSDAIVEQAIAAADVVVWLNDMGCPTPKRSCFAKSFERHCLVVMAKADGSEPDAREMLAISTRTGNGLERLRREIVSFLLPKDWERMVKGPILLTERQRFLMEGAIRLAFQQPPDAVGVREQLQLLVGVKTSPSPA
ncbi:MAG: GTPase [Planctomycetota bacterium]